MKLGEIGKKTKPCRMLPKELGDLIEMLTINGLKALQRLAAFPFCPASWPFKKG